MSLLDTIIRRAVASGEISALAEEPGASASTKDANEAKGNEMANENAPGAASSAGISEADHKAAVTKANADGKAEGAKAANDRMVAILGAEGIKGDGKRMGAALDLAMKSQDMAATDVVAFVSDNVAAAATATTPAPKGGSYEQQRLAAAQLVQPNGGAPLADNGNKQILADAVARTNKRNRR
jgi:hypothetical protein